MGRYMVSLKMTRQDARAAAKARAKDAKAAAKDAAKEAKAAAKAGASSARRQARRATTQVTPLAKSARVTAKQGVHDARVWAAPRVERTGHALEERVAPKVSAMLTATARRLEPARPIRRRRWPKVLAGAVALTAGSVAAAILRSRRGPAFVTKPHGPGEPVTTATGPASGRQAADAETADVNGQVRTP